MKITTKKGDKGFTRLASGKKVKKDADILEVLGQLDELQCFLGACRFVVGMKDGKEICGVIDKIQRDLFRMMAFFGNEMKKVKGVSAISERDVKFLEGKIKKYEKGMKGGGKGFGEGFVMPGKNEANSRFHIARTVCRRAEREVVEYFGEKERRKDGSGAGSSDGGGAILKYLNRLSDLLFVLGELSF